MFLVVLLFVGCTLAPMLEADLDAKIDTRVDAKLQAFSPSANATVGDMQNEKGVNIGALNIGGGAVIGVLCVVALFLFKKYQGTSKVTGVLVDYLNKMGMTEGEKAEVTQMAKDKGVAKVLDKVVQDKKTK